MKKKNSKTQNISADSKSGHYNLRNKPISSDEKKNLEKMFSKMKKEIFDEIHAVAENIFEEHKNKIINTIFESQNNENTQTPENEEVNKASKTHKSKKKNKDNNISKESIVQNEIENENKELIYLPQKIKSKKSHASKKNKKKKITKKEISLANGGEKTDASSLNDISKANDTGSKVDKTEKNGNEELLPHNSLIGKKRKREGVITPSFKSEVSNDKKKSKSKSKLKIKGTNPK